MEGRTYEYLPPATWAGHKVSGGCRYRRGVELTLLCLKYFGPIIGSLPLLAASKFLMNSTNIDNVRAKYKI